MFNIKSDLSLSFEWGFQFWKRVAPVIIFGVSRSIDMWVVENKKVLKNKLVNLQLLSVFPVPSQIIFYFLFFFC